MISIFFLHFPFRVLIITIQANKRSKLYQCYNTITMDHKLLHGHAATLETGQLPDDDT